MMATSRFDLKTWIIGFLVFHQFTSLWANSDEAYCDKETGACDENVTEQVEKDKYREAVLPHTCEVLGTVEVSGLQHAGVAEYCRLGTVEVSGLTLGWGNSDKPWILRNTERGRLHIRLEYWKCWAA
ncbi:uncharacterized protein LOC118416078 [Branchiostoma floridae]|uniref:Uncharacterized protein LOC118416078 n=1 Tax=Branchiostoma floridae TaxID=7739 RepID=A0A9J7L7D3_BRAFL|nr:uncharacterized protein LOC118416078 [Branchiostoma floridae]